MFMFQAITCLLSGLLTGTLGRKRAMFLVNIPHLAAWLILYYARSVTEIFVGNTLLGDVGRSAKHIPRKAHFPNCFCRHSQWAGTIGHNYIRR